MQNTAFHDERDRLEETIESVEAQAQRLDEEERYGGTDGYYDLPGDGEDDGQSEYLTRKIAMEDAAAKIICLQAAGMPYRVENLRVVEGRQDEL